MGLVEIRQQHTREKYMTLTDEGFRFVAASAAKRVHRKTAECTLTELLNRVELINTDPSYLYKVTHVVVFGSYLDADVHRLSDLDVAVKLVEKRKLTIEDKLEHTNRTAPEHIKNDLVMPTFWPMEQALRAVKNRKRTISIQDWDSFTRLVDKPGFNYEVVFGDARTLLEKQCAR